MITKLRYEDTELLCYLHTVPIEQLDEAKINFVIIHETKTNLQFKVAAFLVLYNRLNEIPGDSNIRVLMYDLIDNIDDWRSALMRTVAVSVDKFVRDNLAFNDRWLNEVTLYFLLRSSTSYSYIQQCPHALGYVVLIARMLRNFVRKNHQVLTVKKKSSEWVNDIDKIYENSAFLYEEGWEIA